MIKAIFFDVDGTLVSLRTHTVPQSTQTALARLRELTGDNVLVLRAREAA